MKEVSNMGLLSKLKKIFNWKREVQIDEKDYLGIDTDNLYNNIDSAYHLCSKFTTARNEKERVIHEYENITKTYTGIQQIEKMNSKSLNEFENLAYSYIGTIEDKQQYRNRLSVTSDELEYLGEYEEDISQVIQDIRVVEEKQRNVKSDINYIEGEKGELLYRQERLIKTQSVIKVLMIILLSIFAISTLALTIIYTNNDVDIFIPSIIMIVIIGFFGLWIYIFRRYVVHEIKKNILLRQRAVELLNKIKLKYVHNEQFLTYEYKKYKVKSSEILEYKWDQYKQNINDRHSIHKISTNILAIENDIERLMKNNNILLPSMFFENIAKYVDKRSRDIYRKEVDENRITIKNQIDEYENEITLIRKILLDIKENDTTESKEITKIVNSLDKI
jgi:ABC-type multidrug transport system fused ATPase/permease subunit